MHQDYLWWISNSILHLAKIYLFQRNGILIWKAALALVDKSGTAVSFFRGLISSFDHGGAPEEWLSYCQNCVKFASNVNYSNAWIRIMLIFCNKSLEAYLKIIHTVQRMTQMNAILSVTRRWRLCSIKCGVRCSISPVRKLILTVLCIVSVLCRRGSSTKCMELYRRFWSTPQ